MGAKKTMEKQHSIGSPPVTNESSILINHYELGFHWTIIGHGPHGGLAICSCSKDELPLQPLNLQLLMVIS